MKPSLLEAVNLFVRENPISISGVPISIENIRSCSLDRDKAGKQYARVITFDGLILIKDISPSGLSSTEVIELPPYHSKEERTDLIIELYKKKKIKQVVIADYLGISQSTVSKTLRKAGVK